jgi:hypothetical protein
MNIHELYASWGVDYAKVKVNGGSQKHLFHPCPSCGQEFTDPSLIKIHVCKSLYVEKFEAFKFKNLFAKSFEEGDDMYCSRCEKKFQNFTKLIFHFINKHRELTNECIVENWYLEKGIEGIAEFK